jgi:hypothetical protein
VRVKIEVIIKVFLIILFLAGSVLASFYKPPQPDKYGGDKPYTPTRLEWLTAYNQNECGIWLNGIPTVSWGLFNVNGTKDTITIVVRFTDESIRTEAQQADDGKIKSKVVKCDSTFLKKAEEPYLKLADFSLYQNKLLGALDKENKPILNRLISKTIMLSFGVDGLKDRREIVFSSWKSADYKRLARLIRTHFKT